MNLHRTIARIKLNIAGILSLPLPPCETITLRLSEAMEHKLPLKDRILIRLHL